MINKCKGINENSNKTTTTAAAAAAETTKPHTVTPIKAFGFESVATFIYVLVLTVRTRWYWLTIKTCESFERNLQATWHILFLIFLRIIKRIYHNVL